MSAAIDAVALVVPLLMCVSCSGATTSGSEQGSLAHAGSASPKPAAAPPSSASTAAPPAEPEATPREGVLLAYEDARFFSWSDRTRPRWAGEPIDRTKQLRRILPLRVVASRGDYYEVLLGAAPTGTCFGERPSLWSVAMRLWMHRRDVIPSISAPFTRTYADGTSIQIAPGVAVTARDRGRLTLQSNTFVLSLEAGDAIVDEVFAPPGKRLASKGAQRFLSGRGVNVEFGPPEARGAGVVAHPTADRSGHDIEIRALFEAKQGVARVKVEDDCITLVARVAEAHLAREGIVWGMSGCAQGAGYGHVLAPGTELFFPDGERAGTSTERRYVEVRNADWGDRACFMLGVDPVCPRDVDGIELCARRDALVPAR